MRSSVAVTPWRSCTLTRGHSSVWFQDCCVLPRRGRQAPASAAHARKRDQPSTHHAPRNRASPPPPAEPSTPREPTCSSSMQLRTAHPTPAAAAPHHQKHVHHTSTHQRCSVACASAGGGGDKQAFGAALNDMGKPVLAGESHPHSLQLLPSLLALLAPVDHTRAHVPPHPKAPSWCWGMLSGGGWTSRRTLSSTPPPA